MRYQTLDAMRGLAALFVLVAHVDQVTLGGMSGLDGRWAMLVFFLLSGYLVTGTVAAIAVAVPFSMVFERAAKPSHGSVREGVLGRWNR